MVREGEMPTPRLIGSKKVWDAQELDEAFDALPRYGEANEWDGEGGSATR